MNTAEIIEREVQSNSGFQVVQLLRESVGQSGKTPHLHPHGQILPFHIAGRDVFRVGPTVSNLGYNLRDASWGIPFIAELTVVVFGSLARDEYTSGSDADWTLLLTCFSCALDSDLNSKLKPERDTALQVVNHLKAIKGPPLAVLASALLLYDASGDASKKIFSAYDGFLSILNDGKKRKHLQGLRAEDSGSDPLFAKIRELSDTFQEGLDKFFFDNKKIGSLTRKYGVF